MSAPLPDALRARFQRYIEEGLSGRAAALAPIAEEGLKQIAALYRIEGQVRGQSADERLAVRQQKSTPKVATFKIWLEHARTQVSAKSPTGQALKYIAKYWNGLILFLDDGRIEMDNNAVERTIRPIALQRKNALFAGHDAGAQNCAKAAGQVRPPRRKTARPGHDDAGSRADPPSSSRLRAPRYRSGRKTLVHWTKIRRYRSQKAGQLRNVDL